MAPLQGGDVGGGRLELGRAAVRRSGGAPVLEHAGNQPFWQRGGQRQVARARDALGEACAGGIDAGPLLDHEPAEHGVGQPRRARGDMTDQLDPLAGGDGGRGAEVADLEGGQAQGVAHPGLEAGGPAQARVEHPVQQRRGRDGPQQEPLGQRAVLGREAGHRLVGAGDVARAGRAPAHAAQQAEGDASGGRELPHAP